jgi:medium-chain acyl-[acyl-carrier-protein] hydrolase
LLLTSHKTPWLRVVKNDPFASLRLFCFSYAGAGANVYRSWSDAPFQNVEIAAVQLPGREGRMREQAFTSVKPLVAALAGELAPYLGKPFVFFGHSMGALVSFELARELRRQGKPLPHALFLSGRRAPGADRSERFMHRMNDEDLVAELRTMNGTAEGVMEHPEMLALLLPIFRADFSVCENWRHEEESPLPMPIHAFGGHDDPRVSRADLEAWSRQTDAGHTLDMFEGDHFYVNQSRAQLLARVGTSLRQYVNKPLPRENAATAMLAVAK